MTLFVASRFLSKRSERSSEPRLKLSCVDGTLVAMYMDPRKELQRMSAKTKGVKKTTVLLTCMP